jgi:hypothetical protein
VQRVYFEKRDIYGRVEPNASVSVFVSGTPALATIYNASDPLITPTVAKSNPFCTDANGEYSFAAPDGIYDITAQGAGAIDYKRSISLSVTAVVNPPQDSSQIIYLAPYTGAVARTILSKDSDVISIKDFGAKGDGTTDDTAAIQAALNCGASEILGVPGAIYLINSNITVPTGVRWKGSGCKLKAGPSKSGILNTLGVHILLSSCTGSQVSDIGIVPSATAFSLGAGYLAAIKISGGSSNIIEKCNIDLTGTGIQQGVIATDGALYSDIENNTVTAGGIHVGSNVTLYSKVIKNTIVNAVANGISIYGDNTGTVVGALVDGNTIINPARMGIEDFPASTTQKVFGTQIINNTIIGGASATFSAISAVGNLGKVGNNFILNWPNGYAIEIGALNGTSVYDNDIVWTNGNSAHIFGIQQNPNNGIFSGANIISRNKFNGAYKGVDVHIVGDLIVSENSFYACYKAFDDEGVGSISFINNNVHISTQSTSGRNQLAFGPSCIVCGNKIVYESSASGGTNQDIAILVSGNAVLIAMNNIDGGSTISGGSAPAAISNSGSPTGLQVWNNTLLGGATFTYGGFVSPIGGNNVGTITGATTILKTSFYDNQTPVVKPTVTGAKAANAALVSLMPVLASLGLVTDSTT